MIAHRLSHNLGMCAAKFTAPDAKHGEVCRRFSAYLKLIKKEAVDLSHNDPEKAGRILIMINTLEHGRKVILQHKKAVP